MKKIALYGAAAVVMAAFGFIAWQTAWAQERAVKVSDLPKAVADAAKKAFPDAKIRKAGVEPESVMVYEVSFTENGTKREIAVTDDGTILEVETVVERKDLPEPVARALAKAAGDGKVRVIEKIEYLAEIKVVKLKKPKIAYEVKFRKDGRMREVKWDSKGKVLTREEDEEAEEEEEEGEGEGEQESEELLTIDQVPAAVRATILKEAGDAELKEIERETKGGQTIYEAEWVAQGETIEIKVAPDGKLLGKEVEQK
ncbi:MAG: PepSY-like domain-containing protein [Planctomycetota bacterium]|jgi:uncharacterized membrane protein YkoI